jgi:hypothetical protein
MAAVEDILNLALDRIKYPTPIGEIFEGSRAARIGLRIYGQTRDNLLREADWDFAKQEAQLILQKTAPVGGYGWANPWSSNYPPLGWIYQYAYPVGCLKIRSVRPTPTLLLAYDPQPNRFDLYNDPTVTPNKVVVTNLAYAQATITAQVTDTTQWNASFVDALVSALASRFQAALSADPNMDKEKMQTEAQETGIADARPG